MTRVQGDLGVRFADATELEEFGYEIGGETD